MQHPSLAQPPSFQMKALSQSRDKLVWQKNPKDHLFQTRKLELAGKKERVPASPTAFWCSVVTTESGVQGTVIFCFFQNTGVREGQRFHGHMLLPKRLHQHLGYFGNWEVWEHQKPCFRHGGEQSASDQRQGSLPSSSQADTTSAHRANGEFFLNFFFEIKWHLAVGKH